MTSIISVKRRTRFSEEKPYGGMSLGLPPSPSPTVSRPLLMWSKLPRLLANWMGLRNGATITEVPSRTFSVMAARYDKRVTGSSMGTAPVMASCVQRLSKPKDSARFDHRSINGMSMGPSKNTWGIEMPQLTFPAILASVLS